MARVNFYGQNRHTLVIDGIPISGFAEGDFIQIKEDGNAAVRSHGADGPTMSYSTSQGGNATFSLQPTSPAIGILYGLREQQKENQRFFTIMILSGVDELINLTGCAFGDQPQFATGGPTIQGRQFSIECLSITMDQSITSILG